MFSGHGVPGFLFNTYRGYTALVLQGMTKADTLLSKECMMQGDPLPMLMYASAFIQSLSNPSTWIQNWYTDDSS